MREGWATLVGVLGAREAERFASETALLWLRPDAVAAGAATDVLARVEAAGFTPVGASAVRLGRAGVRALWWWQLHRATAERLLLLDAVVELGPGLLVSCRHPGGDVARRLTRLKGGSAPVGRQADLLRSVAGSLNLLPTMVHTSDDPLDGPGARGVSALAGAGCVGGVRAGVQPERTAVGRAGPARRGHGSLPGPGTGRTAQETVPDRVPAQRGAAFAELVRDISAADTGRRWEVVEQWSRQVPLLTDGAVQRRGQRGRRASAVASFVQRASKSAAAPLSTAARARSRPSAKASSSPAVAL